MPSRYYAFSGKNPEIHSVRGKKNETLENAPQAVEIAHDFSGPHAFDEIKLDNAELDRMLANGEAEELSIVPVKGSKKGQVRLVSSRETLASSPLPEKNQTQLPKPGSVEQKSGNKKNHTLSEEFTAVSAVLQALQGDHHSTEGSMLLKKLFETATGMPFNEAESSRTLERTASSLAAELRNAREDLVSAKKTAEPEEILAIQKKIGAIQLLKTAVESVMGQS